MYFKLIRRRIFSQLHSKSVTLVLNVSKSNSMRVSLTILLLLTNVFIADAQTTVSKIDSLVEIAKTINDVNKSKKILDLIKEESSIYGYKDGLASYAIITTMNLFNSGKFAEALEKTYREEQTILGTKNKEKIAHLYALRANCFMQLSFYERSRAYLLLATKYANDIADKDVKFESLGRIYRITAANFKRDVVNRNLDSVLFYHKRSYDIQNQIKSQKVSKAGLIIQGGVVGSLYLELNNIDSSKYYFDKAISYAAEYKLQKHIVYAHIGKGDIFLKENKTDSALNSYNVAKGIASSNNNGSDLKIIYQRLADVYEKDNQMEQAKFYFKKYALLADSLLMVSRSSSTVAAKYIINEQEVLRAKKDQLRNTYVLFAGLVALMSIVIVIILYKNISASKKNNDALNEINAEMAAQNEYLQSTLSALEQSYEDNNRVMQIITHDLRSPMAAIVGLSDFMIKEHNLSAEDLEVMTLIHTSGIDSLNFINGILEKETEAAVLKKEIVNLHQLVKYCITQSQFKAKEKGQKINLEAEDVSVSIHREKIWRVISNLTNNAIKFSPAGTIISVKLKVEKKNVLFSISDRGIGIPDNLKDKIFSKSDESKRLGTAGEASFGVGLSICKQIVEAHGGELWFESTVGIGTTFHFTLPSN